MIGLDTTEQFLVGMCVVALIITGITWWWDSRKSRR